MRTFAYILSTPIFVLAISLGIAACATIISGSQERVIIKATPPGAEIAVDGRKIGPDSVECKMERGSVHYVDVTMDGFRPTHIRTGIGVNPWYWGNLITVTWFGLSVDLISNAAYNVNPNSLLVDLLPGPGESTFKTYDTNGSWIAPLPLEIIGGAFIAALVVLIVVIVADRASF
jgi:PEGA domain